MQFVHEIVIKAGDSLGNGTHHILEGHGNIPPETVGLQTTDLDHAISSRNLLCEEKTTAPVQTGRLYLHPSAAVKFIKNRDGKPPIAGKIENPCPFQYFPGISHATAFCECDTGGMVVRAIVLAYGIQGINMG